MDLQFKMGISLTAMLDFISPKETLKISIQAACFFLKTQSSCKAIRPWDMGTNIWEDDPRTLLVGWSIEVPKDVKGGFQEWCWDHSKSIWTRTIWSNWYEHLHWFTDKETDVTALMIDQIDPFRAHPTWCRVCHWWQPSLHQLVTGQEQNGRDVQQRSEHEHGRQDAVNHGFWSWNLIPICFASPFFAAFLNRIMMNNGFPDGGFLKYGYISIYL